MPRRKKKTIDVDSQTLVAVARAADFGFAQMYVGDLKKEGVPSIVVPSESDLAHAGYLIKVCSDDYEKAYRIIKNRQGSRDHLAFLMEGEAAAENGEQYNIFVDPDRGAA